MKAFRVRQTFEGVTDQGPEEMVAHFKADYEAEPDFDGVEVERTGPNRWELVARMGGELAMRHVLEFEEIEI